jgi:hypothetical protein
VESLYLNHSEFMSKCKYMKRRKQNHKISYQFFDEGAPPRFFIPLHPPPFFSKVRKFLVLVCDWKEREARTVCFTTESKRTRKFGVTTRSARAITSRYARKKFGFHHIDGKRSVKPQSIQIGVKLTLAPFTVRHSNLFGVKT